MTLRVINQLGPRVTALIRAAAVPVDVIDSEPGMPSAMPSSADVLFAPGRAPGRERGAAALVEIASALGVRWVHLAGAGAEGLPDELFVDRIVTCSRGAYAGPISEFVLASMLAYEKRFPLSWLSSSIAGWGYPAQLEQTIDEDGWAPPPRWGFARLGSLDARILGLVGLGGIGEAIARKATAFGMHVVALRRHPARGAPEGVALAERLADVLCVADHLVLAAPATEVTRRLLDDEALTHVKHGVHVVNVGRGALVDQDALLRALDDGRVGFASLDVVEPEPLPDGHPLFMHERVHITPHISWCSPAGTARVAELFVENLVRYVSGEPLAGVIDPCEGY